MNALRLVLAAMVTVAWGFSVAIFLIGGRRVDPWVHLIFAAIATGLFGPSIWRRNGGG